MKAPIFPVFALKMVNNEVLIGGGGGNEHFGKKNGIVLLDETTYEDLDYLETDDIIIDLSIYKPGVNDLVLKEDDLNWDEHSDDTVLSVNKTSEELQADLDALYLACRGTESFYFVKLKDTKFSLIKKVEKTVTKLFLINSLFLIINKELFCVYDILRNYNELDYLIKKKNMKMDSFSEHEEYIYTLYKKNNKILVEREGGKTDVPEHWENFFIAENEIHKIIKENDLYTFVYKKQKYDCESEIGDIIYSQNMLVYYLKGVNSKLFFIVDSSTIFDIPKITCMNVEDDYTTVGTGDGFGYLFKGCMQVCKRKLCDYAITGISFRNGNFYYSSYNGLVDKKPIVSVVGLFLRVGGCLLIILAIILAIIFKK